MATRYTQGILTGELKTFKDFALLCSRAFGATIHMRDESLNEPYKKREISTYHQENIDKSRKKLEELNNTSDNDLININTAILLQDKEEYKANIEKIKKDREVLESFLLQSEQYNPPTEEHKGIKEFMIKQLKDTINWDADTKYYEDSLIKVDNKLDNLNATQLREEIEKSIKDNIAYHIKELNKEIERVNESNKWMDNYIESLN